MPSVDINMSGPSQEELLERDLLKLKIDTNHHAEQDRVPYPTHLEFDIKCTPIEPDCCPYGSAVQTIASIFNPKVPSASASEAIKRCEDLEAQLKVEQEMVTRLKEQLALSEKMLEELRSVHSRCPLSTKFEDLPEELMVSIFSYLQTDTLLFTISKVCRQWKRLSEDNLLWSQVSINGDFTRLLRTLHHAPCLKSVFIPSECLSIHDDDEDEFLRILTKTKCRLRSLTVPDFQPIMLRMLRNQMALGYLRHVHLNSWWDNQRFTYRGEVWRTLALLDLVSLTLHEFDGGNSYFQSAFRPSPGHFTNLRHLDLYCKCVPGEILSELIRACRASLLTVALPPKSRGEVLELLAECPKLEEANVPFLGEVCALEHANQLGLVELNAEWLANAKVKSVIPDVIRFLHSRPVVDRLHTLFFQGMQVGCRELLRALSRVRGLRFIRIYNFGEPEAADVIPLVLAGLPSLERFTIATLPPPSVIDAIAPAACPGLRELTLIGACHDDDLGCRIPALMRLLSQRPDLHVFLDQGLSVKGHLEGLYPDCLRFHRHVCDDESLWHRFYPTMTGHQAAQCMWCLHRQEDYATVVDMEGRLNVDEVPELEVDA